jgi:glycosyltransferase involved in cell wall biosynthesis
LKVAVFLTDAVAPEVGGGFSYMERLILSLDSHPFHPSVQICFTGRMAKDQVKLKKDYYQLRSARSHKIFNAFEKLGVFPLIKKVFGKDLNFQNKADIATLRNNNVGLILYPRQIYKEMYNFPFVCLSWDIGHRSTYSFPEFVEQETYRQRVRWYNEEIQKALAVFVESEAGKEEMIRFTNIWEKKVTVVPIFPGRVAELNVDQQLQSKALAELNLKTKSYFYYPAQFWAHKNQYNLVRAFAKVKAKVGRSDLKLVLSGSDQGNKNYIRNVISEAKLDKEVVLPGFVSNETVYTLYRNARALVMPSFLGPTNMPVLEAQSLGIPIICSDLAGHREICKDSALYIDPLDEDSIAAALEALLDDNVCDQLVARSVEVRETSVFRIENTMRALNEAFVRLVPLRNTFD